MLKADVSEHFKGRSMMYDWVGKSYIDLPLKMEPTQCSETSAFSIQKPGIHPKENVFNLNIYLSCRRGWGGVTRRNYDIGICLKSNF
jgi:hypothetical protein